MERLVALEEKIDYFKGQAELMYQACLAEQQLLQHQIQEEGLGRQRAGFPVGVRLVQCTRDTEYALHSQGTAGPFLRMLAEYQMRFLQQRRFQVERYLAWYRDEFEGVLHYLLWSLWDLEQCMEFGDDWLN